MKTNFLEKIVLIASLGLSAQGPMALGGEDGGAGDIGEGQRPRQIVETDLDAVFGSSSGESSQEREGGERVRRERVMLLEEGVYCIEDRNNDREDLLMLVRPMVNNPDKFLAIVAPKSVLRGERGRRSRGVGWVYQGRSIQNGREIMLSPLTIDENGNLIDSSEAERRAPVVRISKKTGENNRNDFLVRGVNGGLTDGTTREQTNLLEMKKVTSEYGRPNLKTTPTTEMFVAVSSRNNKLVVFDGQAHMSTSDQEDFTYEMINLNGEEGALAGLVKSEFDTMAQADIAFEKLQKLATFYTFGTGKRSERKERFVVLTRSRAQGLYNFEVFQISPDKKSILENFFEWLVGE
jgi:hypothetical protein